MKYNLSEITELIRHRRSINPDTFSDRLVHREQVELILQNAIWAPSHGLTQPWRFVVFMDQGLKKLAEELPEVYRTHSGEGFRQMKYDKLTARLNKVSVVVAICMERDPEGRIPEIEEIESVACAVQNMYLTATAYGLGAFWSSPGFVYSEEMRQLLGIPESQRCLGLFYLGYPSGEWPRSHRRPLEYATKWVCD